MLLRRSWLWLGVLAAGCGGGGGGGLPPERPPTTVTGAVVDGPLVESDVRIYSYVGGLRGDVLASARTSSDGRYTVQFQAESQPVLVEADGGYYLEDATDALIPVAAGEGLMAAANLVSGSSPQVINVTPLTLVSTGLAQYRVGQGVAAAQAIDEANGQLVAATGINPVLAAPLNVKAAANGVAGSDPAAWHGFLLAGLSNYTASLAAAREGVEHQDLPTIRFARLMYDDIRADGVLDGKGPAGSDGAPAPLDFGGEPLTPAFYRSGIAQNMLAVANNGNVNRSGLSPDDILAGAKAVGESRSSIFPPIPEPAPPAGGEEPGGPAAPADTEGPSIATQVEPDVYRRGSFEFAAAVADPSGVSAVQFDVDGKGEGEAADPLNPSVMIDTTLYSDGEHKIGVSAWDWPGNLAYSRFPVLFDNTAPKLSVTSPELTNTLGFDLTGKVSAEGAPTASLKVDGTDVAIGQGGAWSARVRLIGGVNRFTLRVADSIGNTAQQVTDVAVDLVDPEPVNIVYNQRVLLARGDGTCREARLDTVAPSAPIYIWRTYADLKRAGILSYTAKDLDDLRIPYIQFQVDDEPDLGVSTPRDQIAVRMAYSVGESVKVTDRRLSYHRDPAGRTSYYLLPFASDTLHADFEAATPNDRHTITLELRDLAGNRKEWSFSFWTVFGDTFCPPRVTP